MVREVVNLTMGAAMDRPSQNLILLDAVLPNGANLKVTALSEGRAHDVSFPRPFKLETFEEAISGVAEMAKNAVQSLTPDDTEIEFGLGLTLEAGKVVSLLTSVGSTASIRVRLRWHSPPTAHPEVSQTSVDATS